MAHAHTKYIENNSKKAHSTRAQRLCAAVRKIFTACQKDFYSLSERFLQPVQKIFTACQENIYRLSRKYLQSVQKIFISCRKDFYCTVRNILHIQPETFHVYSQKHSCSACGKIFTVLAGKSPQYTQKKTCKCAVKRFFPINFARVAVLAVLLCVCGAASAWGQDVDYYYWNEEKTSGLWNQLNWKILNILDYEIATTVPETNDVVYFGPPSSAGNSPPNMKSRTSYNIQIPATNLSVTSREIAEIHICLRDNTTGTAINFTRPTTYGASVLNVRNLFEIQSATGLTNININFNINTTLGTATTPVNFTIPSGVTLTIGNGYTTTIYGNITIENGGELSVGGTLNVTGNITNNGNLEIRNSGKLTVTGNTPNASEITNNGTFTNNGTLTLNSNFCTFNNNGKFTNKGTFYANGSPFKNGAIAIWDNTGTVNIVHAEFTFPHEVNDSGTWVYSSINDRLLITNVVYNNLTLNYVSGHVSAASNFTVKGNIKIYGTFYLDDYTLTAKGTWYNEGAVYVGANGKATFDTPATDDGQWIYQASRTGIVDIKYSALNIGDEDNQVSVTLGNAVKAGYIAIAENNSTLDLVGFDATVDSISTLSGKIRLHGNQTIAKNDGTPATIFVSDVEFYGDTGEESIKVSTISSDFETLVCDLSGGSDEKVLDFSGVTSIRTLTLKGNDTNKLGITGNAGTSIALTNAGSGSNLRINHTNVGLTGQVYDVSDGTSVDFNGAVTYSLHNGWKFSEPPASSTVYYWVGGNGNWSVASNWKYNSATGITAAESPGTNANAEVHIEPTSAATVTLDVSPAVSSVTMTGNATLSVGANTLTVNNSWTTGSATEHDTRVVLTTGNVVFGAGATINENGGWRYEATRTGIANIPYYSLIIGDGTVTPIVMLANPVTANQIFINDKSTLDLVNYNIRTDLINAVGTVSLYGNQNITDSNETGTPSVVNSGTVEFYGNTGNTAVSVSKMGTIFDKFICDLSGGTDKKVLDFSGVTSIRTLTLKGNDTNKLGITATTETNISLANDPGSTSDLRVDYTNVKLNKQYTLTASVDFDGKATYGLHNGWLFPATPVVYYWVGGNGNNWSTAGNWSYTSGGTDSANESPGTYADAEVHITTGGTVSLNTTPVNSLKSLEITNNSTLNLGADLNVTNTITIGNATTTATLDLANFNISANTITNNGTVRLHGTQTVTATTINNNTNSTVEFYGTETADVSKMGATFHHLRVTATNARTATFNGTTTVNGNMTLTGANTNSRITINGTNNANIIIGANAGSGTWLNIDYDKVAINNTSAFSPSFNATNNCFDIAGNPQYGLLRGWKFADSNVYYWVGGDANWSVAGNWHYGRIDGGVANEYPGANANAEVHITNGSTVTQNVAPMTYALRSLEITNGTLNLNENLTVANTINVIGTTATLALGEKILSVNGTWSNNNGTVTVTSGNAIFASVVTDSGTWTYENADNRNLINITYNNLNLNGTNTNTITAQNDFTVRGAITINNNTTLALDANNLTVQNTWTNNGIVTVTTGNATLPANAQDSGTWNYNNITSRVLANLKYKTLNLNGPGYVAAVADVFADTIKIAEGATFDLVSRNLSASTVNNNGTVHLYGSQTVTGNVTNGTNSTVEYYGTVAGDVSKFGNSYYDLVCTTPGKTLNFNRNTTVQHYLTLRGSAESPLTINTTTGSATPPVTITVNTKQGESLASNPPAGRYLLVNRSAVHVAGTTPLGTVPANYYYYAEDSFDIDEDDLAAVRNGWKLKMIELEPVSIALAQIDGNTLYLRTNTANMSGLNFAIGRRRLPRYFTLVTSGSPNPTPAQRQQAMQIAYTTEARIITAESGSPIWIAFTLNNPVKLEHLSRYFIREKGKDDNIYFHALSDFAVGVVEPRYAFDNRYLDSGNAEEAAGGVAIRNWDKDQESNGQLVTESDITISAGLNGENLGVPIVYFDASPDAASVSTAYNSDAGGDWRIWLPQAFASLSPAANSEYITFEDGAAVGGGLRFDLPVASGEKFSSWKAGDQISFLFELKDANGNGMTVCHEPVLNGTTLNTQTRSPLYALRLRNAEDATSLDLWSFKLRDITTQRGSITIMNNVINVLSGENMILDVNVPVSGVLNIMVMTLDGTIVKYLQHGSTSQGKHVYHWDGRNNAGKPVARGLYFIRIVGCTLDETRKVMAVWK